MTQRMRASDVPAETYTDTVARLAAAQKSNKGAPLYSRYVNRPWGRRFAAIAYHGGLTPDQVTAVSAIFTFGALGVLLALPQHVVTGVVAAAMLATGYALDAADGQLARLRGGGSVAGEWLDHMVDSVKTVSIHMVVLIGMYRADALPAVALLVPMVFAIAAVTGFYAQLLNEQLRRNAGVDRSVRDSSSWVRSLAGLPTDYGALCWVFVLWGLPTLFAVGYGLLAAGTTGYVALALVKWHRDMTQIDSQRSSS